MHIGARLTAGIMNGDDGHTLRDWFEWLSNNGFKTVDVQRLTPEVREEAERANLEIGTFDIPFSLVSRVLSKDVDISKQASQQVIEYLESAAALGGTKWFLVLKPNDTTMSRAEVFDIFVKAFSVIVSAAEHLGIKLVVEGWPGTAPHYSNLGSTPEMLRAMFQAIPSPALGITYDPSHLIRLGIDYLRFLREFSDRIGHVHGKDCIFMEENVYLYGKHLKPVFDSACKYSEGPWRYTIPGEGMADWKQVAFELENTGYKGSVSVELEDHRYEDNKRHGLKKSQSFLSLYFR